ncbi:MAG: DUF5057 domain-containing protein [Lachnospira sp.]|nr:DUF5057 domain-containing protein [Lachnospira sp.]
MKKKIALIVFTIVCTLGLTISIASFSRGSDQAGSGQSAGNALDGIYDSYVTQVQHIIDNSNLDGQSDEITHYHIVQIVDSLTAVDKQNQKIHELIEKFISNADDEQTMTSGNFRTDVIGKEMKNKHIDIQTFLGNDANLAEAIRNADLVYIACNSAYTSNNDLHLSGDNVASDAVDALETYAISQFKPVLIDADVVGVTNRDVEVDNSKPTIAYDYLKEQSNKAGSLNDNGVSSVKRKEDSWKEYLNEKGNPNTTYVTFDNMGRSKWNTYNYAPDSDGNFYKHKVLEIVPDSSYLDGNPTELKTAIDNGDFLTGFANPSSLKIENIQYGYESGGLQSKPITVSQLNDLVAAIVAAGTPVKEALYDYEFIYINHSKNDKSYFFETDASKGVTKNDFSSQTLAAIKGFVGKKNTYRDPASKESHFIDRLMIDGNFFSVYNYASSGSTSNKVDTTTKIYNFATKLISADASTAKLNNVEIVYSGFFDAMDEDKSARVTALINRSTYRDYSSGSNGTTFNVLEIEPYYNVDDTKWYSSDSYREKLSDSLTNETYQEVDEAAHNAFVAGVSPSITEDTPFYRYDITKARIAAATGLNIEQINVVHMSANALCSTAPQLIEDYDLIYLGSRNESIKDKSDWYSYKILTSSKNASNGAGYSFISFNADDLNHFYFRSGKSDIYQTLQNNAYVYNLYTHTGDFMDITDQRNAFTNRVGSRYERSSTRINGNDITSKVYADLYEYISAGMPVICDKGIIDSDYLIGGASANAELVEDAEYVIESKKLGDLHRYKLKSSVDNNATVTFRNKNGSQQTITYKATNFSDKSMIARKESNIDPESYIYQLMYQIAENKTSGIYHAQNVLVGFDSQDVVTGATNYYLKGVTSDSSPTCPDDIDADTSDNKSVIVNGLTAFTDIGYNNLTIFNNNIVRTAAGDIDYANSGAGIQLKHFLNMTASSRPVINLIAKPYDYNSQRDLDKDKRKINPRSPIFTFSLSGEEKDLSGAAKTYEVRLYYDFDGDGKFSDDKTEGRLEGSEYDTEMVAKINYTMGSSGLVTFKEGADGVSEEFIIDKDFVGVMPYKLVAVDTATGKQTSITGYPKYYAESDEQKQQLRLLQIIPGYESGDMGNISQKVTTLCADENTLGNGSKLGSVHGANKTHKHEFGIVSASQSSDNLASRLFDEYDIKLDILTTGQFSEAATYYIQDVCNNIDQYQEDYKWSDESVNKFKTEFMSKYYNSSTKKLKSNWDAVVDWSNTTIYDFDEDLGITDEIFRGWLTNGDAEKTVTIGTKDYNGKEQDINLGYYDMVVIGFAKEMGHNVFERADINNIGCQIIRAYVENNGSILLGTDTTSYEGFFDTSTMKWSRNINQYLRDCFGMDRFKFTKNGTKSTGSNTKSLYNYINDGNSFDGGGTAYIYTPYKTAEYSDPTGQTHPGEFFTLNSYDGTYEQDTAQVNAMAGAGGTDAIGYALSGTKTIYKDVDVENIGQGTDILPTTQIRRNNVGLITNYPFNISAEPRISKTNAQSYALDTEDEDMQIWYSLAGANDSPKSNLYAADPLNGRSFYYIYSYRSVTYTGAGYTAIAETADNDEERKLIINSILSHAKIHRSGPKVVFSEYTGSEPNDSVFTAAKGAQDAVLECSAKSKDKCNFDFTVSTAKGRTFKDITMFKDEDGDGVFDPSKGDIEIKGYTEEVENGVKVIVDGKSLPDSINTFMQEGSFVITVRATDSDDKSGFARLVVKTKSKLFNLN